MPVQNKTPEQRNKHGQSMVEFAFCVPFLLMMLLGMIYFGRYFMAAQSLLYAAQEGARTAAKIPNLSDPAVRDVVRGFSTDGAVIGPDDPAQNPSPIYCALSAARMLSGPNGTQGSLPQGATIQILPWDTGAMATDTVTVQIQYPFGLTMSPQTGKSAANFGDSVNVAMTLEPRGAALSFANFNIQESASAAQEIYQQ